MSEKDFLTGCLSKEMINSTLDRIKAECKISKLPFSVLVLDLDHFKSYNDKYGHIDGDEALKYFASTLRLSLGDEGVFIFRFGGDEFFIAFSGKNAREAHAITVNVIKNLKRRPFLSGGRIFKLGFSAGIASYPSDGNEIEEILQKADKAMYFSKTHGRGKVTLYSHILRRTVEKIIVLFAAILLIAASLLYLKNSSYKDYALNLLKKGTSKVGLVLKHADVAEVRVDDKELDLIYLKSGRVLKGIILRDDKDAVELSLSLDTSMGSVTIRKTEIDRIVRRNEQKR